MVGQYYFQQLPEPYRSDIFRIAVFYLDTSPFEDDVRTYGLDAVMDAMVEDAINRHNTERSVGQWFRFAEEINEYV